MKKVVYLLNYISSVAQIKVMSLNLINKYYNCVIKALRKYVYCLIM